MIERYVKFYNRQRPSYALGYDTPDNYYRRYQRGELEKKEHLFQENSDRGAEVHPKPKK